MDRKAKQELKRQWQALQRARARAALPLAEDDMKAMFDWLDWTLPTFGCDHTRVQTSDWLKENGHPVETVLAWLSENGGHCDCEVLANSEQAFEDATQPLQRPLK